MRWTFALVSAILGVLLFAQFNTISGENSIYADGELEAERQLTQTFTHEQESLQQELIALREELTALQEKTGTKGNALEQIQNIDAKLGLTKISGKGLQIFLGDSPSAVREELDINNDALVHAADLRDIVNLLWSEGAEAIAINGQRLNPTSSINCLGNSFLIDSTHLLPPFTIAAVGEPAKLAGVFENGKYLPDLSARVAKFKLPFYFETKKQDGAIEMPTYRSNMPFKYLTSHE